MGTREWALRVHPSARPADSDVLISEAHAVGLVSDRELREGQVRVGAASRRGTVHALIVRGHLVGYAKRPSPEGLDRDRLADERVSMQDLGGLDLVPRVHRHLAAHPRTHPTTQLTTLWMSALPGSSFSRQAGTMSDLADGAQAFGLALARLHTECAARPSVGAQRPWLLTLDSRRPGSLPLTPSSAAVLRLAVSDPTLRRAARQASDRWTDSGWIHGDLRAEHVIVDCTADPRVRFADLSTAGAGDPGWDVACALESVARLASIRRVSEQVLTDYLLRGYRRGGGPGRLDPELRALRAMEIAWQLANGEDRASDAVSDRRAEPVTDHAGVSDQVAIWLGRARAFAGQSGQFGWAA